MGRAIITALAVFWAGMGLAQDWVPLSGAEIATALTGRTVLYDGASQKFFASGRTLYTAGQDSWGTWAVRDDQYCSLWPPGNRWDCYGMTRRGADLRFVDGYGNVTEGQLIKSN